MKTAELLREDTGELMISKIVKQMIASKGIDVWITTLKMGEEPRRLTFQTPIKKIVDKKTTKGIISRVFYDMPDGKESWFEFDKDDDEALNVIEKDGKRVEKQVQVIVDDQGNRTVVERDGLPPPQKVD